uniref:Cytochrome P450 n=1 Tax=Timema douglasi TaxID=61478 RepID=A0A7R8VLG3_TIMDO|nr:unnamed protein product [Timema douglasi]
MQVLANSHETYDRFAKRNYILCTYGMHFNIFVVDFCRNPLQISASANQIPGTNVNIDKETNVIIPVYATHHDPRYYPEPEKLDPERLSDENIKIRPKFTNLPSGEGPRNCIGLRFGLMQVKVGLTALLSKYKFSVCEKTSIPVTFNPISFITLRPRDIHLKISHRDN